jgi:hypothetical protein
MISTHNLNLKTEVIDSILKQKKVMPSQIDLFFEECNLQKLFFSGQITPQQYMKKIQKLN